MMENLEIQVAITIKVGYTTIMESNIADIPDLIKEIYPFTLLEDEDIGDCLQYCQFVECAPGTRIFSQGDRAERLYFILDGEVKIKGLRDKTSIANNRLFKGDHFGEAAISGKGTYKSQVESATQTTLIVLNQKNLSTLMKIFPCLHDALSLMDLTWKTAHDLVLPWLAPGERIYLVCRRHRIIPLMRLVVINLIGLIGFLLILFASFSSKDFSGLFIVLAFLFLLGGILLSIWAVAEWANDEFLVTSGRVVAQRQMYGFFDSRQESPISAILSTAYDASLSGRLIGYGTVSLRSYTGEIKFKQLPYPESIFDYLEYLRGRATEEKKLEEKTRIHQNLVNRLGDKSNPSGSSEISQPYRGSGSTIYQSGSFMDWLARFFQLRQERGSTIIYRTHWWIMIRKTIVPFILILVLLFGFIGKLAGLFSSISETTFYMATLFLTFISAMWWLYQYFDWYNDQYILTKDQLIDVSRKPLGYEDRRSAPVKNIQTVEYKRKGLLGLLLNYGTVRIQIGNEELTFDNVYAPSQIQGEVYLQLKRYQEEQQHLEGQRMAEWITTYDQIKKGQSPENSQHE
jgi:hypothetical protein